MRLTLAALLCLGGCGISPGDYVIYRVAAAEAEPDADCFPNGEDPSDAEDTTTFRAGQTFALFSGGGGTYFLEVGSAVLEGVKVSGAYDFSGESVDIDYYDNASTTVTTTLDVLVEPSGAAVSGTVVQHLSAECSGSGCAAFTPISCGSTTRFLGTRVKGVDLEHAI